MKRFNLILIILLTSFFKGNAKIHPEGKLQFMEYCNYFNYPVEEHVIQTSDGYLLTFFRIQAKNTNIKDGLKVVYLQHGLLDSSDTFIINDEDKAPAFILANRGYDVWMGNNRGTKHSKRHIKFSHWFSKFWDFTMEDFAIYDLPAAFEYIHQKTNQKIRYIGHSQGTTQMHIHLSLFKESVVRDDLLQFVGLGPAVYVTTNYSPLTRLLKSNLIELLEKFGMNEFLPGDTFLTSDVGRIFCGLEPRICGDLIGSMVSADPKLDNYERYDWTCSGTSVKNLKHWQQFIKSGQFKRYDYGSKINMIKYGQNIPPQYNLGNVDVPLFYIAGYQDLLVAPKDVQNLYNQLTNNLNKKLKFYESGHCTFVWGRELPFLEDLWDYLD